MSTIISEEHKRELKRKKYEYLRANRKIKSKIHQT